MCVCAHSSNWSAKVVECSKPSNDSFIDLFCNTHMCVCSQQQLVGQPSIDFFCNTHEHSSSWSAKVCRMFSLILHHTCVHVCAHSSNCRDPHLIYSETHTCMPTAAIGRPTLDPWVQPYLFCNTHVCVCAHSSNWSAKVVECSKPSSDFFIDLFCNTHVCARSSNWSVNPQVTSSGTHMCVCAHSSNWSAKVFRMLKASKRFFCTTHVCAQSSNGRDPHLSFSETHMCMPTAATGRATLDPWVQPSLDIFCNTHVCVLTAAIGLPNLVWATLN